jgi:hypothetical protein
MLKLIAKVINQNMESIIKDKIEIAMLLMRCPEIAM